jgi:hypothetical protein
MTYCTLCKTGYITNGDGTCTGQYDHKYVAGQVTDLTLPDLSAVSVSQYTIELYFKTSDPSSSNLEVIMGLSPIKLRKMSGSPHL